MITGALAATAPKRRRRARQMYGAPGSPLTDLAATAAAGRLAGSAITSRPVARSMS
jgi:hypothetical protein